MISNLFQITLFAALVFFAVVGANAVDRQLAVCAARAGYLQVVQP